MKSSHQRLVDGARRKVEPGQIAMGREACRAHLVGDRPYRPFGPLGIEQLPHQRFRFQCCVAAVRQKFRPIGRHAMKLQALQPGDDVGAHRNTSRSRS